MTLVLSALTRSSVILVADRRLTNPLTGLVCDDQRNKATVYANHFAFAYSGICEIQGKPTDVWLAQCLANGPPGSGKALKRVAAAATTAFANLSYPAALRRHAFVGVGWGRRSEGMLVPVWVTISNALDANWRWLPKPKPHFEIAIHALRRSDRWTLCPPVGAELRSFEIAQAGRALRPAVKRVVHPVGAALILGQSIGRVAARENTVGRSLIAVVLPKPDPRPGETIHVTPPIQTIGSAREPMSFDLDPGTGAFKWVMPNFVLPGQVLTRGTVVGEDGRVQSFQMKISKPQPGTRVGIGLRGGGKEVFFGMDASGKPFCEQRERH
jgi:hypothetical protein